MNKTQQQLDKQRDYDANLCMDIRKKWGLTASEFAVELGLSDETTAGGKKRGGAVGANIIYKIERWRNYKNVTQGNSRDWSASTMLMQCMIYYNQLRSKRMMPKHLEDEIQKLRQQIQDLQADNFISDKLMQDFRGYVKVINTLLKSLVDKKKALSAKDKNKIEQHIRKTPKKNDYLT
jgi:hypothetical protein